MKELRELVGNMICPDGGEPDGPCSKCLATADRILSLVHVVDEDNEAKLQQGAFVQGALWAWAGVANDWPEAGEESRKRFPTRVNEK